MTAPVEAQAWSVLVSCRHETHPYPVYETHMEAINAASRACISGVRAVVLYRVSRDADWVTVHGDTPHDAINKLWRDRDCTPTDCLTCGTPTAGPPPGAGGCSSCPPIVCSACGLSDHITAGCLCWRAVDMVQPELLAGLTSEEASR